MSLLIGNAATLLPETSEGDPDLYIPHKWATEPPGFSRLLANPAHYGFPDAESLRAAFLCAPGEVPMKAGTPWPVDASPPWDARKDGESDYAYRRRIQSWVEAQPLRGPVD